MLETKIKPNTVRPEQLENHLQELNSSQHTSKLLLVLTPDQSQPNAFEKVQDEQNRLVWASFAALHQAIDELLEDVTEVVSEREAYLLRELQGMLAEEGLTGTTSEVVVVAARHAWPGYQEYHAYICQPKRAFKPVERLAFYSRGQVYPLVPSVLEVHDEVLFEHGRHKGMLGQVVDRLIDELPRSKKEVRHGYKVFLLSAPNAPETMQLDGPILNDSLSKTGNPTAFTMGQRYVAAEKFARAKATSDLT